MSRSEELKKEMETLISKLKEGNKEDYTPRWKLEMYHGEDYVRWCITNYEKARNFLKNCGRPKDWYDEWLIQQARFDVALYVCWAKAK